MSKKPVIVFEGIEGSGKTYHIDHVSKYLKKKKINYIKLREPGGTSNSEKIRKLILNNKSNFNKETDLLNYILFPKESKEYYLSLNKHTWNDVVGLQEGFGLFIE